MPLGRPIPLSQLPIMPLLPASLFGAPTAVDDTPPTREQVAKAMALPVLQGATDEKPTHTLASLVEGNARTIVVFIRHHHCGMCVKYVQALSAHPALRATSEDKNSNIKLLVIGHGSHVGIEHYREISSAAFNMYVDETKQLYGALGLTRRYLGKAKDGMVRCGRWGGAGPERGGMDGGHTAARTKGLALFQATQFVSSRH